MRVAGNKYFLDCKEYVQKVPEPKVAPVKKLPVCADINAKTRTYNKSKYNEIYVVSKRTGEILFKANKVITIANEYKMSKDTIYFAVKNNRMSRGEFFFRFDTEYDPDETFDYKTTGIIPIIAEGLGKRIWFNGIADAARFAKADADWLSRHISYHGYYRLGDYVYHRQRTLSEGKGTIPWK